MIVIFTRNRFHLEVCKILPREQRRLSDVRQQHLTFFADEQGPLPRQLDSQIGLRKQSPVTPRQFEIIGGKFGFWKRVSHTILHAMRVFGRLGAARNCGRWRADFQRRKNGIQNMNSHIPHGATTKVKPFPPVARMIVTLCKRPLGCGTKP